MLLPQDEAQVDCEAAEVGVRDYAGGEEGAR